MTSDILKRAAEAVEDVAPGPWRNEIRYSFIACDNTWHVLWDVPNSTGVSLVSDTGGNTASCKNDARFIAAARTLIPDMAAAIAERDEQIERLTARAEAAEAQVANAGAVMVETCAQDSDAHYAAGDMGNPGHHIRALSTLSPIAAAARVLLADPDTFDGFKGYILNRHDMDTTMSGYAEGAMDYLRALAEQEKADG